MVASAQSKSQRWFKENWTIPSRCFTHDDIFYDPRNMKHGMYAGECSASVTAASDWTCQNAGGCTARRNCNQIVHATHCDRLSHGNLTFETIKDCAHGGSEVRGKSSHWRLSLHWWIMEDISTSTVEATYSKTKGLDDFFTEMWKSYASLFMQKNPRARPSEGISPFASVAKVLNYHFTRLFMIHEYSSIIFLI